MPWLVPTALIGWSPVALGLFLLLPPRRAVLVSYIAGWLLLPVGLIVVPNSPDYTKHAAIALPTLVASLLFDSRRWALFRPKLVDVPMAVFCLTPFATAMATGYGPAPGISEVIAHLFIWGIPYILGRAYFPDWRSRRELALGILVGVLVYLPLVWYEIRMAPILHRMVYGYLPNVWKEAVRYGGWRPWVFMQSGLMLAMWFAVGAVLAFWLWRTGIQRLLGVRMAVIAPVLAVTVVLCRSGNAIVLALLGLLLFGAIRVLRSPIPLLALALAAPVYISLRSTGLWSGRNLAALATSIDADRGRNFAGRMRQEEVYTDHAWKRPFFGWRGEGFIPRDPTGERMVRGNDSFWIITFGKYGLVSLVSVFTALALPPLLLACRVPARLWAGPKVAPTTALATVVVLFTLDCLMNSMQNPVCFLAVGAVCGLERVHATSMLQTTGPAVDIRATGQTLGSLAES